MGDSINTEYTEAMPFVAPDNSYLIFDSNRPGGFGDVDLYISFRKKDGSWIKAKNMGSEISSSKYDSFIYISPDKTYFFFGSYRNGAFNVYCIDARIIN